MIVKEEYLIYDDIAFISSIGGTLGLCIGFSFSNMGTVVLSWMELIIRRISQRTESLNEKRLHQPSQINQAADIEIFEHKQRDITETEQSKAVFHLKEKLSRLESETKATVEKLEAMFIKNKSEPQSIEFYSHA